MSPCRKRSQATGVWRKSDEESDRSVRKVAKMKNVIELLLLPSSCSTLMIDLQMLALDVCCFPHVLVKNAQLNKSGQKHINS